VAGDVKKVREMAGEAGRTRPIEFAVRHVVCVHETKEEARRAAESIVEDSSLKNTGVWAQSLKVGESQTQQRVTELASREDLLISDTIYMGVNRVRQGVGTMFVDTPEMVANQIREYVDVGVSRFIMHGWPHLEEAEIFGREVMPLLKDLDPVALTEPAAPAA
jgi:alkanesulfonate monooxygenase